MTDFFLNIVKKTVNYRETNKIERKDFLQMLIEIKNDEAAKGQPGNFYFCNKNILFRNLLIRLLHFFIIN